MTFTKTNTAILPVFILMAGLVGSLFTLPQEAEAVNSNVLLSITCDDVQISETQWTISGTWKAYNGPGQSDDYDIAAFSPEGIVVDANSALVLTNGPSDYVAGPPNNSDDMEGTWSNVLTLNSVPTYLAAALYHAAVPGNEQSGDATCTFTLPQCSDGEDNDGDGFVDFGGDNPDPACDSADDDTEDPFNEPVPTTGTLIVNKVVVNDNGGEATADDFVFQVNGGEETPLIENGENPLLGQKVIEELPTGVYTVTEVSAPGYSTSYDGCTEIEIIAGEEAVCTITNDDIAPFLELVKEVIGDAFPSLWTLTADGPSLISGEGGAISDDEFWAGQYTLSESGGPNYYQASGWSCVGDVQNVGNVITLGVDQSATCTITNTYTPPVPGSITIVKNTSGGDDSFDFSITGGNDFFTEVQVETTGGSGTSVAVEVAAGTYNVVESVPAGWDFDGVICEYDGEEVGENITNGEQVTLGEDDSVTCTFYNIRETGTLIVNKVVVNDNGGEATADDFVFQVNGGEETPLIENGENPLLGQKVIEELPTGVYTVTEVSAPGYSTSYDGCTEIEIIAGEEAVCTITNDDIEKPSAPACSDESDNDDDGFSDIDDPECHTDGNAGNSESYDPEDDSESALSVCSDDLDNDSDGVSDSDDPACHTDGNAGNSESYDPQGASEDSPSNGGGGGGSGNRHGGDDGEVLGEVAGETELCGPLLSDYLRISLPNNPSEVSKLQEFLNGEMGSGLPVTGTFGPLTDAAVRAFQVRYWEDVLQPWWAFPDSGIHDADDSTGYVYKTTKLKINNLFCPGSEAVPTLP